jgi:hypothetical protein
LVRYIPVRLTRKLANFINGVDLTRYKVGDVIELPSHAALMLMGEGWGEPMDSDLLRSRDLSKPRNGSDVDAA